MSSDLDSCRCGLDADGTFWIAPALGQREGTAKGEKRGTSVFTWFTRGIGHTQNKVRAVRVLGTVHLIGRAETLFWNSDSCVSMDLAGLDVSKVEDMSSMFEGCSAGSRRGPRGGGRLPGRPSRSGRRPRGLAVGRGPVHGREGLVTVPRGHAAGRGRGGGRRA